MRHLRKYISDDASSNEFIRATEELQENLRILRAKWVHDAPIEILSLIQSVYDYALRWHISVDSDTARELARMYAAPFDPLDPVYIAILEDKMTFDQYHPFHYLFSILQEHLPQCTINDVTFLSSDDEKERITRHKRGTQLSRSITYDSSYEGLDNYAIYNIVTCCGDRVTVDKRGITLHSSTDYPVVIFKCRLYYHVYGHRYGYHICTNTLYDDAARCTTKHSHCARARIVDLWCIYPKLVRKTKSAASKKYRQNLTEVPNFL